MARSRGNLAATVALALGVLQALSVTSHAMEECGWQAGGAVCPRHLCCGLDGYCGLGSDYCGHGCQSGACGSDLRCGSQVGGALCAGNLCCSGDGFCGLGGEYCNANRGCQSGPCSYGLPLAGAVNSTTVIAGDELARAAE